MENNISVNISNNSVCVFNKSINESYNDMSDLLIYMNQIKHDINEFLTTLINKDENFMGRGKFLLFQCKSDTALRWKLIVTLK